MRYSANVVLMAPSEAAVGYRLRNPPYRTAVEVSEQVASRDHALLVEQGL